MATDAFLGSPLARGQDIHGTLRAKDSVFTGGLSLESQDHTNKTLGFLLADSSIFLLSTGMKGQGGRWLNPALSSATPVSHRQGKLLITLEEKAGRQLFLLFIGIQPSPVPHT